MIPVPPRPTIEQRLALSHHPAQADQAHDLAARLLTAGHTLAPLADLVSKPAAADRLLVLLSQQWMDEIWPDLAPAFATPAQRGRLLPLLAQPCALPAWLVRMRPIDLLHDPSAAAERLLAALSAPLFEKDDRQIRLVWRVGGDDPDQLRVLDNHADFVTDVALLDAGRRAVSASADGTLILWDLGPAQPVAALTGHSGAVNAVAATALHIFSAGSDGTLRRWTQDADVPMEWRNDRTWDFPATVHTLHVSADGQHIVAAAQDAGLTVLDLAADRLIVHDHIHTDWVRAVALFPDGAALSAGDDRVLALWDVATGQILRRWPDAGGQAGGFISALFPLPPGPDGHRRALAGSDDRTLAIWDVDGGRVLHSATGHATSVRTVAATPDGTQALSASNDGDLRLWTLADGAGLTPAVTLTGHTGAVSRVQLRADGGQALSASTDHTLRLWNLDPAALARPAPAPGHDDEITALALSPSGHLLASAGEDCTVRLWDASTGAPRGQVESQFPVLALAFGPNGETLLTASEGGRMVRHALPLDTERPPLAEWQGRGSLLCAALSPDGRWAAAGSVNWAVILWDWAGGGGHRVLSGHRAGVTALVFLEDGRLLSGDESGVVRAWGAEGEEAGRWQIGDEAITAIVPVSGKNWAVIGGEGPTPRLIDLESGALLAEFVGHEDWVLGLGDLGSGRLVTGADDGTVRAWDTVSGAEMGRITMDRPLSALVVDPAKSLIYVGDVEGRLTCFELVIERG